MIEKAKQIRKERGDRRYYAPLEDAESGGYLAIMERTLGRPFKILFQEPMLLVITIYMSVCIVCATSFETH